MEFWRSVEAIRGGTAKNPDTAQDELDRLFRHTAHSRVLEDDSRLSLLRQLAASAGLAAPDRFGSPSRDYVDLVPSAVLYPGISVVVGCRNRTRNLLQSISTWLACPDVSEIVVVDWSSDIALWQELYASGLDDPRIRVFRVVGERRWCLSETLNVGFRLARHEYVLKADADTMIARDFFRVNRLARGEFRAGNWRTGQGDLNGTIYAHLSDILAVSGYSEFIRSYGWDDDDLYHRLTTKRGLLRIDLEPASARALQHDDAARVEAERSACSRSDETARETLRRLPHHLIRFNQLLSAFMPEWPGFSENAHFRIRWEKDRRFLLRRSGPAMTLIHEETEAMLHLLASYHRLSWANKQIYQMPPEAVRNLSDTISLRDIARIPQVIR